MRLRSIADATAQQLLSIGLALVDRIVLGAVLIRQWGLAIFEDWTLLFSAASLAALIELGLYMTFSNSMTAAWQQGRRDDFDRQVAVALGLGLGLSAIGVTAIGVLALGSHWRDLAAVSVLSGNDGRTVLAALAVAVVIQAAFGPLTAGYRATGRFARGIAFANVLAAVRIVLLLTLASAGRTPVAAALAYLIATALFMLVLLPLDLVRNSGIAMPSPSLPQRRELAGLAAVAPWFYVQQSAANLLLALPVLTLPYLDGRGGVVATFAITRTLVNVSRQVLNALANSLGVELAHQLSTGVDRAIIGHRLVQSTSLVNIVNAVGLASLYFLLDPFVRVWSGDIMSANAGLLLALVLGAIVSGPFVVASNFLNYAGEVRIGAASRVAQSALTLLLAAVLAPRFGVLGIALAIGLGEAIGGGIVYMRAAARWSGLGAVRLLTRLAIEACGAAVLIVAAGLLVTRLALSSPLAQLCIRAAVLLSLGLAIVAFLGLPRERTRALLQTVARRLSRG